MKLARVNRACSQEDPMTKPYLVVLVDLGLPAVACASATKADPDAWLAALAPETTLPAPGGKKALYSWTGAGDFRPAEVAERIPGAAGTELDRIVQAPQFQKVESAWRGVRFLLEQGGDDAAIEVIAVPHAGIVDALRGQLLDPVRRDKRSAPLLILLDFDFTHQAGDLGALGEIADIASELNAPAVAAASPAIFGLRHFAHLAAFPDPIAALQGPSHGPWRAFQASEQARWICLTLGRYLQRAPHDLETLSYHETVAEARPESFLWGRGTWVVGAAAARSLRLHGHALDLSARGGMFTDMPSRGYPKSANESVALSTEAPLPEMRASELAWAGFTPLAGVLRAGTVLMPMVVTCSRLSPGKLTVEGSLAYQLLAARLASCLGEVLSEGPLPESIAEAALRGALLEGLGSLAGESPETAIVIELAPAGPEPGSRPSARVRVTPHLALEGKQPEFAFELPLRGA
jgi:hypothetical protein